MNYVLDTCVVSELIKPVPAPSVEEWLASIPAEQLFLSTLTVGEIKRGIMKLPESKKKVRLMRICGKGFRALRNGKGDRTTPDANPGLENNTFSKGHDKTKGLVSCDVFASVEW